MKSKAYFDYAAATPVDKEVLQAMEDNIQYYANPSASYSSAREANKKLEQ